MASAGHPPVREKKKKAPSRAGPGRPRADDPHPALGSERILKAALALIDEQGLAAFNVRSLAGALGVFPSAIYWHVPSRDALVAGAIGIALHAVADDLPSGGWHLRLATLLRHFRAALRRHPNLAPAVASQLAYNAAFDAPLLDQVVAALEDARFEGAALVDAFNVVIAAMCGFATLELSTAPGGASGVWEADCRARIESIDPLHHPHLARHGERLRNRAFLLRWSSGQEQPLDSGFDAWIDVVLRGLEARSRSLRRPPPAGGGHA